MSTALEKLSEEIKGCTLCELHKTRKNAVVGAGNEKADIMLIGEAPGRFEDEQGVPFVGVAGQRVLNKILAHIGLKREDIYITNIVKCRPPNNRNPATKEIALCAPYLDKQIELIQPKVICTLGNFSTKYILNKYGFEGESISKVHGKIFRVNNLFGSLAILPLYHPAAALYNPNLLEIILKDAEQIEKVLETQV